MIKSNRSLAIILIALVYMSLLSACGGGRNESTNSPTSAPQSAPVANTPRPFPTARLDTTTSLPATSAPVQPSPLPPTAAAAKSAQSSAALQQLLEQLAQANAAGDSLGDVPELK